MNKNDTSLVLRFFWYIVLRADICLMWNGFFLFILICHSYVNQLIGIQVTQNTIFFRVKLRQKNRPSCIINSCLSNFLKYLLTSLFKEYSFKLQAFSKLCVYLIFYFVFSFELFCRRMRFFFQIVYHTMAYHVINSVISISNTCIKACIFYSTA